MKPKKPESGEYVRSVDRVVYIIQLLNQQNGVNANFMATASEMSRPTAYRMLETLRNLGLVRKDEEGKYWLEPQILSLSSGYCDDRDLSEKVGAVLRKSSERIPWPLTLSTRAGNSMVIRASTDLDSPGAAHRRLAVGWAMPGLLTSAAGTIYLACSDSQTRAQMLDLIFASNEKPLSGPATRQEAEVLLQAVAEAGHAVVQHSVTWNWVDRTSAIGLPIFTKNRLYGALSMRFFRERLTSQNVVALYLDALKVAAIQTQAALLELHD